MQRFTRGKVAFAKGSLKPDAMNKQEKRYDAHLAQRLRSGEILWYKFQGFKLRLADNTFYTPDFNVIAAADGVLEMHEVKGFWQDTGRVKIKVAADLYPMRFVAIKERAKKNGGGYEFEDFSRVEPASELPLLESAGSGIAGIV
jgi:hypothetical protein